MPRYTPEKDRVIFVKKFIRVFSLLMALLMVALPLCSCSDSTFKGNSSLRKKAVEHEHVAPLLLWVGLSGENGTQDRAVYGDELLQRLVDDGVSEYVMLTGYQPLYYNEIDEAGNDISDPLPLFTEADIDTLTKEDLGVETDLDFTLKIEALKKQVPTGSSKSTINRQIEYEIELAKRIIAIEPDAKIWFSLPHVKVFECASFFVQHYMDIIYTKVKLAFTEEEFAKNVWGLYWATEDAGGNWDQDDPVLFGNSLVKAEKYCSDILHKDGKTLMWIPYTTDGSQIDRIGMIANTTDVFDYVYLQPGYLWHEYKEPFLDLIDKTCETGAVVNYSGTIYGGEKKSSTVVGVEIELDNKFLFKSTEDELDRYLNGYVAHFEKYKDDKLFAVYCGDQRDVVQPEVYELLVKWWN